jgi:hypothetical protein
MGLDIRIPIGLMFATLGIVLVITGLVLDNSVYQRSLGINVNLWWGLVLFVFGALMFIFGRRGSAASRPAEESFEGQKTEEREHQLGLENESTSKE